MVSSYLDTYPIQYFLSPDAALNVSQTYKIWALAARQVWLNIFSPNDREKSVLRSSLLASNLDSLFVEYIGTLLLYNACL